MVGMLYPPMCFYWIVLYLEHFAYGSYFLIDTNFRIKLGKFLRLKMIDLK